MGFLIFFPKSLVFKIDVSSALFDEIKFDFNVLIAKDFATSGLNLNIQGLTFLNII